VARNGENAISLIGGSNMAMDESDVERGASAIANAKILLLQREVPFAASCAAARHAKAKGVTVVLDPAPAPDKLFNAGELELFDILTPNELETAALIGWQPASPKDGVKAAKQLQGLGVKTAIVKLGAKGACVAGPGVEAFIKPFRVEAIDTVAAGDCFNGGLAHALEQGWLLEDAVRFAAACGALSTTKQGAAAAAPTKTEVEAFLAGQ
jgi:ribokinase